MISGVLLAAGTSTRMGRPKALLEWGDDTLIAYQVRQLREAGCDEVVVVLGFAADAIHRRMKGLPCRVMLNPRYHAGRSGSVRIGAKAANRDSDRLLFIAVDQPRPAAFLRHLLESHEPASAATRPIFEGRHGHPVVVSGRLRPDLMTVTDESEGLRSVLRAHGDEIRDIPTDDLCLLDLNTPEDYRAALTRFGLDSEA